MDDGVWPWRYVEGHRWRVMSDDETTDDAPALPAVTEPPAIERVPITERTIGIAREMVLSALVGSARDHEQKTQEDQSCDD